MEQPSSQEQTRTRTASISAPAAIVHSLSSSSIQQKSDVLSNSTSASTNPFHHHPWSTERAKVAAETEISPPISPKQHATLGSQADDFLEPLQESNSSLTHHYHPSSLYDYDTNSQSTATLTARRLSRANSHHNNNITSTTTVGSGLSTLEPVSAAILFSHTSSSSSAVSSTTSSYSSPSANSSTTSLSSISLSHQNKSSLSFEPLETEASRLFQIDTPPSSHAASPSSESYPTLKGEPATLLPAATSTTTIPKKSPTTTRAPYHCTSKSVGQIVREISDAVDGRDKTIKVVQYFAKVFLWLFLSDSKRYALLATRLKALAKQFSNTRKVLRLAHFIDPLASVLTLAVAMKSNLRKHGLRRTLDKDPSQKWGNAIRDRLGDINTVIGFVQDIADDIYCLGVIGVLDRSFADKAEPWSNRLWMVGVTIDLHENLQTIRDVRKQIKALEAQMVCRNRNAEKDEILQAQHTKLTTKLHWLKVTTVKLGGDFLFCGYDNLHCSFSDGFQAITGLISGLAGAYKYVGKIME
ncbi:hypothetical protein FBU30_002823 [Linnemannia zychae]|nr:hypothetical protein FBU30_002823 [Linnemannia zychae]